MNPKKTKPKKKKTKPIKKGY
jgi:hypothetical protein